MSKFFDFCNKKRKPLFFCFLSLFVLFLLVPTMPTPTDHGWIQTPYIYSFFYDVGINTQANIDRYDVATYFKAMSWINSISALLMCLCLASTLCSSVFVLLGKKPRFGCAFIFILSHFFVYSFQLSTMNFTDVNIDFETPGNAIAMLVLFFLYIVYLLLRRYYAPVKARIQASRAERQANRKPTKDERIAELERKVAELESKDKDEQ